MGLLTVSSVSRTPRVVWPPPTMPQRNTRRASSDFDAIDPAFPPPSLKTPQTETGWDHEKRKKKDKKWSIGGLFRRKKKVSDTDSSSPVEDEEEKKGFLERRRAARKRRNRGSKDVTGSFEHVIINPPRSQRVEATSNDHMMDMTNENLMEPPSSQIRGSSVSLEGTGRKGNRIKTKARVEANRGKIKLDSSSDEGGGSSRHSTSSIQKVKSDDTSGSKDGSLSRRSRAARTERYKKRISKDEDSLKEFQTGQPSRISRSDERLSNKKSERASSGNRWTAKVVYCESSDYDTKYTAKTKSATPSPIQSPKTRPKNALHYTASAPPGSTYVTFPPSYVREGVARSHQELRSYQPQGLNQNVVKTSQRFADLTPPRLPKSNSDMINKAPFSSSAPKHYPSWGQDVLNRKSASYDCNVNSLHHINNHITQTHPADENVLVVQFPIGRPVHKIDSKTNITTATSQHMLKQSNPPPPPPRDPHRRLVSTNGHHQDTSPRPMSYAFEDRNQHQTMPAGFSDFGSSVSAFQRVPQTTQADFKLTSNINKHHRSNSDHHIPARVNSVKNSPPVSRRPSSVHPEVRTYPVNLESYASSPPDVQTGIPNNYQYFTDQQPRSRKPIHITYQQQKTPNDSYLSDSQVVIKPPLVQTQRTRPPGVQNASDFWKQKDQESAKKVHVSEGSPKLMQRHFLNVSTANERSRSHSPHVDNTLVTTRMKLPPLTMPVRGAESSGSLSSQSSPREIPSPRTPTGKKIVHNEIGIPVFDSPELSNSLKRDFRPLSMLEEKQETSEQELPPAKERLNNPPIPPTRRDSKINAVTNFEHFDILDDDFELKEGRRKSSNLEEALNELEAIYKSLRLGEEGYIEKVAREKAAYENNRLDPSNWNAWVQSRGFESDSSFNYSRSSLESVDSVDSPIKRSNMRKSGMPDRVTDDMAYRRLNKKDRHPPQEQEVISQAGSFLLVSPTLSPPPFIEPPPVPTAKNEPDITLDDVVYRNINHINNSLKVLDPQPPFGIPLGPITPAPNSDYLHATPKEVYRPTFKPRKTPDVVTDDLAFRNLRKDNNKEPLFAPEDTTLIDSPTLKKKRAVRSLSANLLSIIQKESMAMNNKLVYNNNSIQNDLEKSQSFTDVTNANVANGQTCRQYLGENRKQSNFNSKKNLSGEDSDPTPRGSRIFSTENSSPLFTTSTETLTGSKSNVWLQDPKLTNQNLSQNSSPRLSFTPERRHTTDNVQLQTRKSMSPAKHVPVKLEPLKCKLPLNVPSALLDDFHRSPTPDSHTFTHHKDINEEKSQSIYNQKESELLAALAREAKEASEQLSRELNELNFEKTIIPNSQVSNNKNSKEEEENKGVDSSTMTNSLSMHSKSLPIGKITPHKPVKLNTFCITSDNKLENKQTILMDSPGDIESSKSMTDLLKELTKGLDLDFGNPLNNTEKLITPNTEQKVLLEGETEEIQATIEITEQEPVLESNDLRTTLENTETDESHLPSNQISDHKLSTPERLLLSSFPNTQPGEEQREKTISPVNRFPLSIPDDTSDEELRLITHETRTLCDQKMPVSSEILPADDSRPSEGCSRDCSSLADEEPGEETCAESAMVAQLQPSPSSDWMDPVDAARQQRIARYKEERRRQLAAQYGRPQDTASGSSSGGGTNVTIRSTRASRLRSAAASTNTNEGTKGAGTPRAVNGDRKDLNGRLGSETPKELSEHSPSPGTRDKSSKRKSNLNRSLNAEPVPPPISITANEDGARRRRSVASPVVSQSPKTSRPTSTHAPDSDSPRSASARVNKRVTPPRETTARPRPRSSSGLLERQNSASQVEPTATPPAVNGFCSIPTEEPSTLPDVVVLPSSRPSSILKKKSVDETPLPSSTIAGKPVSILKRKTSQEEATSSAAVQPVTFSPSVVEPGTNNSRRQGILKKHRSLDDGRRSVSPPSSLRRSSLEELRRRTNSPEPQSILKRKTSREEGIESPGFSEPQGILKRKISSGSSGPVHVTIAESVILAVAGEDSLCDEAVKPILKKKSSICEEPQDVAAQWSDTPRPILKKKSSSETDDGEEKPKKPILKSRRDSGTRVSESRSSFTDHETMESCTDDQSSLQNGREERNIPSALSARAESSSPERLGVIWRKKNNDPDFLLKRRSFDSCIQFKEEKRESPRSRASFSVAERVINMENFLALETQEMQRPRSFSPGDLAEDKGALPKRGRDRDRWRTQPITVQELSSSRNWSPEAAAEEMAQGHALTRSNSVSARASLFEAQLKQKEEEAQPKRVLKGSAGRRVKLDPARFQTQPVTQDEVEEARKVNDATKSSTDDGDDEDPSKLSLAERVRLFNTKMVSERMAPRPRQDRHKTQPVTPLEVQTAQKLTPISRSASSVLVSGILKNLTEKNEGPQSKIKSKISSESEEEIISEPSSPLKRGILKSQSWRAPKSDSAGDSESSNLRSVLKKDNKKPVSPDRRISKDLHSILKVSKEKESSSSEETETESEDDKPNTNSDLIDLLHKVEAQARGERKPPTPDCNKTAQITSNNKKPEESDKLMNLKNLDQGKENYNVSRRFRRKKVDGSELSEGDSSSSGGREVRKIIGNDAVARRRQAGLNREVAERGKRSSEGSALSKSRSHSAMNGGGEVMLRPPEVAEAAPLRRCRTQPMDECDEPKANGVSIAQRLEALQKRGHTDWKKRISRLNPEEELPPTISINAAAQVLQERLAAPARPNGEPSPAHSPNHTPLDQRLELLETSTQDWRKRVSPSDANQFSVAGRMPTVTPSPLHSPALERRKKIPKPERFRSKGTPAAKDTKSVPTSPEADSTPGAFKRSISAPSGDDDNSLSSGDGDVINGPLVSVPKAFDDDFSSFFASKTSDERIELRDEDLEEVINSTSQLLVQRRTVKVQRRRGASTNPVKALAARTDLRSEYVEVRTGVAQREEKRLRVEKLAKNSSLAVEALAGLASQEDFAAVTLRSTADSTAHLSPMLPYKELMLLHIKGRRHVQTRLVCPHYSSVNQGDSYVLVTPSQVFHWVGEFSNVIERSRGAEIAQHIARTRDLGCTAGNVTTLQGNLPQPQFWRLLGADETIAASFTGVEAGHPDEDELYELALTDTNMIYEVEGEELVPRKDCWGTIPKIEILHHNKVLVFDFGAELYVWMGKTVTLDRRRTALRLGQELWAQGYDYSECDVCPLTQAEYLGSRPGVESVEKKGEDRPDWALLAKVTQHMETVLLREKFLDWPDFSRVIQVKSSHKDKQGEGSFEVKPCDAQAMVDWTPPPPDLVLEGSHLGRGTKYFDPESHKHYEVSTLSVTMWHVQQYDSCELDAASLGQLHSGDTYVVRWCYSVTVTGRELTGQPSRHAVVGRDRCAYFTWQGADASTNDKGAAALLTVQLDQERGPQLRLTQGQEPPAFRQLFGGGLIIHKGRRCDTNHRRDGWRLYMISGEEKEEVTLVEVSCSMRQLRSRACLLLLYPHDGQGYLWRGTHTLPHAHQVATTAVERLKEILPSEAGLEGVKELQIHDINEGKEPKIFFEALGGHSRQLYMTSTQPGDYTTRLFHLTSASGVFQATPIVPACHHPSRPTPFPYSQHHLYSVRQPALFLVDGGSSLWLWQGWWGEEGRWEDEGVGEGRWQAERRAAMTTALEYHRLCSTGRKSSPLLVWAGLEPLDFTNLFPSWTDRDDIAELNIRDGRKPGEVLPVEEELERLTRSTYPPAQLLQRPLPQGIDPTRLEEYLAPHHFQEVLGLSKEDFTELPAWKQNKLKQEKGLF